MAARIPQMPPLDPNRPDEAFRQITAWGNDVRLALESRQAAMEGLTLNPDSPLWAGRNLPGIPVLPVPAPTGFQAWGVYDAIQLVWDLQPDPAIDGYELLRDSAIIDFVRANCYTDIPIGDLDAHTYELRTVRVGDGWRSAGVTATATAQTDEATIRANHDAAFLGHQVAAMARNAATEVFADASGVQTTESQTFEDVGLSITIPTAGNLPILLFAHGEDGNGIYIENTGTGTSADDFGVIRILRQDDEVIASTSIGGYMVPSFGAIRGGGVVIGYDIPPAGTYTYRANWKVDTTSNPDIVFKWNAPRLTGILFKR